MSIAQNNSKIEQLCDVKSVLSQCRKIKKLNLDVVSWNHTCVIN